MNARQETGNLVCSIDVGQGLGALARPTAATAESGESVALLRELVSLNRDMLAAQKEQLEYIRRAEERFQKQNQMQKDDFESWLKDERDLSRDCVTSMEVLRKLLGQNMTDMVRYVEENSENLFESDFSRAELVDRFGQSLNHLSGMYGLVKRLSMVDNAMKEAAKAVIADPPQ